MRFNALRLVLLVTAISAVATLGICDVRGDEKSNESRSGNLATNSPSAKPKQNGLKQLEQDLFRPFETLAPKGSLDGAYVPSMPPPQAAPSSVQSKRAKELLEHRRDWVFETPDEILAGPST